MKIVKVDVDEEHELANEFHVASIPTLAFFAEGKFVGKTADASCRKGAAKSFESACGGED
ncbi:MAG: thioredoxin family protein [Planctomycetota bacterium]